MNECSFKVGIVGTGHVGITAAYAMLLSGKPTDLVLIGRDVEKAKGEKLDLEHCLPFLHPTQITASDSHEDLSGSQLIVVTAGVAQQPDETRLQLVDRNIKIIEEIIPKIVASAPEAVIVIVSNPVDILTQKAVQLANLPFGRVFGSGTMLDTARFRFHLSEFLHVNPRSIHTYILGEHGDSSFPALSSATVGGQSLLTFPDFSEEKAQQAFERARGAAYEIIKAKGATFYAIGVVVVKIMESVFGDARTVLPLSIPVTNYHGVSDVSLSVPCILGRRGVQQILDMQLSPQEEAQFQSSAEVIRSTMSSAHLTHQ